MNDLRRTYRIAVIIGFIMTASLAAYLIVVSLIENGTIALRGAAELPGSVRERLRFVFLGLTIVIFYLLRSVNRMVLNAADERGTMRDARSRPEQASSSDAGPLAAAAVIACLLSDVPAILGRVLYFLTRSVTDCYRFLNISLFSFRVYFPRSGQWEEWSRQQR